MEHVRHKIAHAAAGGAPPPSYARGTHTTPCYADGTLVLLDGHAHAGCTACGNAAAAPSPRARSHTPRPGTPRTRSSTPVTTAAARARQRAPSPASRLRDVDGITLAPPHKGERKAAATDRGQRRRRSPSPAQTPRTPRRASPKGAAASGPVDATTASRGGVFEVRVAAAVGDDAPRVLSVPSLARCLLASGGPESAPALRGAPPGDNAHNDSGDQSGGGEVRRFVIMPASDSQDGDVPVVRLMPADTPAAASHANAAADVAESCPRVVVLCADGTVRAVDRDDPRARGTGSLWHLRDDSTAQDAREDAEGGSSVTIIEAHAEGAHKAPRTLAVLADGRVAVVAAPLEGTPAPRMRFKLRPVADRDAASAADAANVVELAPTARPSLRLTVASATHNSALGHRTQQRVGCGADANAGSPPRQSESPHQRFAVTRVMTSGNAIVTTDAPGSAIARDGRNFVLTPLPAGGFSVAEAGAGSEAAAPPLAIARGGDGDAETTAPELTLTSSRGSPAPAAFAARPPHRAPEAGTRSAAYGDVAGATADGEPRGSEEGGQANPVERPRGLALAPERAASAASPPPPSAAAGAGGDATPHADATASEPVSATTASQGGVFEVRVAAAVGEDAAPRVLSVPSLARCLLASGGPESAPALRGAPPGDAENDEAHDDSDHIDSGDQSGGGDVRRFVIVPASESQDGDVPVVRLMPADTPAAASDAKSAADVADSCPRVVVLCADGTVRAVDRDDPRARGMGSLWHLRDDAAAHEAGEDAEGGGSVTIIPLAEAATAVPCTLAVLADGRVAVVAAPLEGTPGPRMRFKLHPVASSAADAANVVELAPTARPDFRLTVAPTPSNDGSGELVASFLPPQQRFAVTRVLASGNAVVATGQPIAGAARDGRNFVLTPLPAGGFSVAEAGAGSEAAAPPLAIARGGDGDAETTAPELTLTSSRGGPAPAAFAARPPRRALAAGVRGAEEGAAAITADARGLALAPARPASPLPSGDEAPQEDTTSSEPVSATTASQGGVFEVRVAAAEGDAAPRVLSVPSLARCLLASGGPESAPALRGAHDGGDHSDGGEVRRFVIVPVADSQDGDVPVVRLMPADTPDAGSDANVADSCPRVVVLCADGTVRAVDRDDPRARGMGSLWHLRDDSTAQDAREDAEGGSSVTIIPLAEAATAAPCTLAVLADGRVAVSSTPGPRMRFKLRPVADRDASSAAEAANVVELEPTARPDFRLTVTPAPSPNGSGDNSASSLPPQQRFAVTRVLASGNAVVATPVRNAAGAASDAHRDEGARAPRCFVLTPLPAGGFSVAEAGAGPEAAAPPLAIARGGDDDAETTAPELTLTSSRGGPAPAAFAARPPRRAPAAGVRNAEEEETPAGATAAGEPRGSEGGGEADPVERPRGLALAPERPASPPASGDEAPQEDTTSSEPVSATTASQGGVFEVRVAAAEGEDAEPGMLSVPSLARCLLASGGPDSAPALRGAAASDVVDAHNDSGDHSDGGEVRRFVIVPASDDALHGAVADADSATAVRVMPADTPAAAASDANSAADVADSCPRVVVLCADGTVRAVDRDDPRARGMGSLWHLRDDAAAQDAGEDAEGGSSVTIIPLAEAATAAPCTLAVLADGSVAVVAPRRRPSEASSTPGPRMRFKLRPVADRDAASAADAANVVEFAPSARPDLRLSGQTNGAHEAPVPFFFVARLRSHGVADVLSRSPWHNAGSFGGQHRPHTPECLHVRVAAAGSPQFTVWVPAECDPAGGSAHAEVVRRPIAVDGSPDAAPLPLLAFAGAAVWPMTFVARPRTVVAARPQSPVVDAAESAREPMEGAQPRAVAAVAAVAITAHRRSGAASQSPARATPVRWGHPTTVVSRGTAHDIAGARENERQLVDRDKATRARAITPRHRSPSARPRTPPPKHPAGHTPRNGAAAAPEYKQQRAAQYVTAPPSAVATTPRPAETAARTTPLRWRLADAATHGGANVAMAADARTSAADSTALPAETAARTTPLRWRPTDSTPRHGTAVAPENVQQRADQAATVPGAPANAAAAAPPAEIPAQTAPLRSRPVDAATRDSSNGALSARGNERQRADRNERAPVASASAAPSTALPAETAVRTTPLRSRPVLTAVGGSHNVAANRNTGSQRVPDAETTPPRALAATESAATGSVRRASAAQSTSLAQTTPLRSPPVLTTSDGAHGAAATQAYERQRVDREPAAPPAATNAIATTPRHQPSAAPSKSPAQSTRDVQAPDGSHKVAAAQEDQWHLTTKHAAAAAGPPPAVPRVHDAALARSVTPSADIASPAKTTPGDVEAPKLRRRVRPLPCPPPPIIPPKRSAPPPSSPQSQEQEQAKKAEAALRPGMIVQCRTLAEFNASCNEPAGDGTPDVDNEVDAAGAVKPAHPVVFAPGGIEFLSPPLQSKDRRAPTPSIMCASEGQMPDPAATLGPKQRRRRSRQRRDSDLVEVKQIATTTRRVNGVVVGHEEKVIGVKIVTRREARLEARRLAAQS